MANKTLEASKSKLERLTNELHHASNMASKEMKRIPFGQPNIIGRGDIYKTAKRYYKKGMQLQDEIEKQNMRIDKLEKVEKFKEDNALLNDVHVRGKSSYATVGAKTSVNNLDYFKQKLIDLEEANVKAKAHNKAKKLPRSRTYGVDITKLKKKIAYLESIEEKATNQILSDKSKVLIDIEKVNQWAKKPIYYFVKGLKKVAFELDSEGNFYVSRRYPTQSEADKLYVEELLK